MPAHPASPCVFGPFDGDFDPFDEDDEFGVLITFGRTPRGRTGGHQTCGRPAPAQAAT